MTLLNSYLKTLSEGTYNLNIISGTGTTTTQFTIGNPPPPVTNSYDIKITKEGNGSISPDGGSNGVLSVREWSDKTFTFTPEKGYEVSDVLVDGKSVGAKVSYSFENITRGHTLRVIFKASNSHVNPQTGLAFEDVQENDWFADAVYAAVNKGWFIGTSETNFSPDRKSVV